MPNFLQKGIGVLTVHSGLDEASFKILLCTLLSFPFSLVFKRLPDKKYTLKHLYIVLVSVFYVFGILELYSGILTLLVAASGCYIITRYLRTPLMPWVNLLFLMAHLAYNHLHAQFFSMPGRAHMNITGAQMVLVMKLSAFGWNIHDGRVGTLPSGYTRERAVSKHPNLLPFLGYVFFYPSLLTGPAFDFVDYDKFIDLTLFDDVPEVKRPGRTRKRRIPKSGCQALSKVLQGLFFASCLVVLSPYLKLDVVLDASFLASHSFLYRIFYLWALGFKHRLKYYTIWLIAEGACILCGIGYNGYDAASDTFRWDRVQNIDPWTFETGQNMHVCLEAWNQNTNKWLKNYVYVRLGKKGRKPGFKSTFCTFVISAFWHGTRLGYYLTFVLGAMMQTAGKIYRRNLRPIFMESDGITAKKSKPLYDIICWLVTQLAFGFVSQPFVILNLRKSLLCWATVYFYVPVAILVTLLLFKGPFKRQVTGFCKSLAPQQPVPLKKAGLSKGEAKTLQVAVEMVYARESKYSTLGVPPLDVLEDATCKELGKEFKDIANKWASFRARRGSFKNDFEGLKGAYSNFTSEINEIYQSKKNDLHAQQETENELHARQETAAKAEKRDKAE